jgi:DNA invertase Pin-like site-specific DNA recombinase
MKYVAYYRVSTKRQGESQLGLKAQKESVRNYISPDLIDAEFEEIETGTSKRYRPKLNEAIQLCKKHDATLVIAKLDRLARNVSFVSSLMDSGIKFKAVDNPHATNLTIHILSAVAQDEAVRISSRVKEGLAQSNKQLGNPQNLTEEAKRKGIESIKHKALHNPNNQRAIAYVKEMDYNNLKLREIADKLNSNGFKTSTGKAFTTTHVIRLKQKIKL